MLWFVILMWVVVCVIVFFFWRNSMKSDGNIVITTESNGKRIFSLEIDKDPDELERKKRIVFKVTHAESLEYEEDAL